MVDLQRLAGWHVPFKFAKKAPFSPPHGAFREDRQIVERCGRRSGLHFIEEVVKLLGFAPKLRHELKGTQITFPQWEKRLFLGFQVSNQLSAVGFEHP